MHFKFDSDYINRSRYRVAMVVLNGVIGDSRVLKTAQTVCKLGYQVCLYGMNNKDTTRKIEGYPFDIVLLPNPRFEMKRNKHWSNDREKIDWEVFIDIFTNNLKEHYKYSAPDFIHTHDMLGFSIGARLYQFNKGKFYWIHDIHEYVQGLTIILENERLFHCLKEKEFITCPDVLITVSVTLSEILKNIYSLQTAPQVVLNTPRLSDLDLYYPKDVRSMSGVPEDLPLLVYSGGVKPARDVETLIEGLSLLSGVHLAIVTNNSGNYVQDLKDLTEKLGISKRIHWLPYVPISNVTSFLRTGTIGVVTAQHYQNAEIAVPTKLFEYIHAGIPAVVSDNVDMRRFVNYYDCGLAFESGNAISLAETVKKVLERLYSETSWCESIKSLSYQYCWERQEEVIASIYSNLINFNNYENSNTYENNEKRILQLSTASDIQPWNLAHALKEKNVSASLLCINTGNEKLKYNADIFMENVLNDLDANKQTLDDFLLNYDIFHFHSRSLLLSEHYSFPSGMDILLLRAAGKKVFFHFYDSEARLASVFKNCSPNSYVLENPEFIIDKYVENEQRIFFDFISGVCNDVFISDPELQTYVHGGLIVPRVIDLKKSEYVGSEPVDILKVVHRSSNPVIKGTQYLMSTVEKLQKEAVPIELLLVNDITDDETLKLYKKADVVVDQLSTGWYSALAVEAMAMGKPVVSYIRDDLRHYLPSPLPLAISNPDNLYQVLKYLALNPEEVHSLGLRGRKYVEDMHDAEKVTDVLIQIYDAGNNKFSISKSTDFLLLQYNYSISNPESVKEQEVIRKNIFSCIRLLNKKNAIVFFRSLHNKGIRTTLRQTCNAIFR